MHCNIESTIVNVLPQKNYKNPEM